MKSFTIAALMIAAVIWTLSLAALFLGSLYSSYVYVMYGEGDPIKIGICLGVLAVIGLFSRPRPKKC